LLSVTSGGVDRYGGDLQRSSAWARHAPNETNCTAASEIKKRLGSIAILSWLITAARLPHSVFSLRF